jgi:phosphohistidine phosphatase
MKRVIIVRHAKSVPYGYDDDFHRDLTDRGVEDASKISLRLKELDVVPDLVIASPAVRTMHTSAIFSKNLGYDLKLVQEESSFYGGVTTQRFVDLLRQLSEDVQTVFIFGHNPTVYYLVYNLVKHFTSDMPTCSTVALNFPIEKWSEIEARKGNVAFQLTPKNM